MLIDLNHDELSQGLRYHSYLVSLNRCCGSCNTLDDPSGKICVPNKIEDENR